MIRDLGNCTQEEWLARNLSYYSGDENVFNNSSTATENITFSGGGEPEADDCNTWTGGDISIIIGAAKIGAVFGTLLAGFLLDIGRRTSVGIVCGFFILGPLIMALAEGTGALIVGRLIVGLGVGASAVVSPLYMAEMSPANVRGRVILLYSVFLGLGTLVCVCV